MNELQITVLVAPKGEFPVDREADLVKAALLYADRVRLWSPDSALLMPLLGSSQIAMSSPSEEQVDLFQKLVSEYGAALGVADLSPEQRAAIEKSSSIYRMLLKKKRLTNEELMLRERIKTSLRQSWANTLESLRDKAASVGFGDLAVAIEAGVLDLARFDFSADAGPARGVVGQYIEAVRNVVLSSSSYPLLDDPTSGFVRAEVEQGMLTVSDAARGRSAQIGLVGSLFERLPVLDRASMNDVLGARAELEPYLSRFRAAVIQYSEGVAAAQWDQDFGAAAEDIFRAKVEPIVDDIEETIRHDSFLRELASRFAKDTVAMLFGPALAMGLSSFGDLPTLAGAVLGVSATTLSGLGIYGDWKTKRREVEKNQLFFYYKAKQKFAG